MDYKNNNDKELARNVLSKYRSFCRVARVDFLTGNLLDGCADQQNKLQNMALIEINKIRKAIEGIPLAMDKSILEMSYIEQKRCLLVNRWLGSLSPAVTIIGEKLEHY